MAYRVTYNNSHFPKGEEFSVGNYFLAKNGEEVFVDDETCSRYKAATGKTLKQGLSSKKFTVGVADEKKADEKKVEANEGSAKKEGDK